MRLAFTALFLLIFLSACQTVQTKVDEKTQQEQELLSKYIGYNINEVYIDFGTEGEHKKDYKGYKKVTFTTKKLGVKCKRIFFYDRSMVVTGIQFAGCWLVNDF